MKTVLGIVMIVSALVLAIAPVFTDCESPGKMLTTADGRSDVHEVPLGRASPKSRRPSPWAWRASTRCAAGARKRCGSPAIVGVAVGRDGDPAAHRC